MWVRVVAYGCVRLHVGAYECTWLRAGARLAAGVALDQGDHLRCKGVPLHRTPHREARLQVYPLKYTNCEARLVGIPTKVYLRRVPIAFAYTNYVHAPCTTSTIACAYSYLEVETVVVALILLLLPGSRGLAQ